MDGLPDRALEETLEMAASKGLIHKMNLHAFAATRFAAGSLGGPGRTPLDPQFLRRPVVDLPVGPQRPVMLQGHLITPGRSARCPAPHPTPAAACPP
jgi:hypothetical protein